MGHLQTIYSILKSGGLTEAAILAMMGNWKRESDLEANRLQGDFSSFRTASKNYVTRITDGTMSKEEFMRDIGFGLAQWTLPSRKGNLWDFWKASGTAIDDPAMQTRFCLWELLNISEYTSLLSTLRRETDLYTCVKLICMQYERPAVPNIDDRFKAAQELKFQIQNGSDSGEGEIRMTQSEAIQKVMKLAQDEIGYHEKASNANLDSKTANSGSGNFTKYARDLDQTSAFYNGPKNGYAWCDVFVDWLFVKCFGAETGRQMLCQPKNSAGAGCLYSAQYYKQAGQWVVSPQAGDQIFFTYSPGEYSHTGIVESVSNGKVITIEGNSSDQVARRSYSIGSSTIAGYGRPKWELATGEVVTSNPTADYTIPTTAVPSILKKGQTGEAVRELQQALKNLGYDLGRYGVDADFGNDTYEAVKKFQKDHGLEADGEAGELTKAALEKALKEKLSPSQKPTDSDTQTIVIGTPEEKVFCEIGDVVNFTGNVCYISYSNDTMPSKCVAGKALVVNVSKLGRHSYQLCKINGQGSTVYGWVDYDDVQKVS